MSGGALRFEVAPEDGGLRLDVFLAARTPDRTRSALRRLILEGRACVDGRVAAKPGVRLEPGATVELHLPPPPAPGLEPQDIPVQVVHEDDAIAVVVKPAGLVVHPGHGRRDGTLVNALLGRGMPLALAAGENRPGVVHRLDRETSGLLVVAKTDAAHRALSAAFARREVRKAYLALVWGRLDPADGEIARGVGRSRSDPTRMSVRSRSGRSALTLYRTVETIPGFTLVEARPVTGRTHQIRVHMQSAGHPVVGDARYGGASSKGILDPRKRKALREFAGLALHARSLAFVHPVTGREVAFEAPLPVEFARLLAALRGRT